MQLVRSALLLPLSFAVATPALADAVTYSGSLGKLPVIVELVVPDDGGSPYGRYAYLSKGVDIPLHPAKGETAGLALQEERPCTVGLCMGKDDAPVSDAPLGGSWSLKGRVGDPVLSGIWRNPDTGRQLPVNLALKGRRPLEKRPEAPFEALNPLYSNTGVSGDPPVVSAASLPYDMLKMTVPLKAGPTQDIGGATLRIDTDPRVGMDYPVVVKLAGVDIGPLNAYLAQQRLQAQMPAFSCLSYAYLGFGWNGQEAGGTNGFDGNWSVTTEHLTPRLMGFMESGSYYCGGAHPHNFGDHRLVDAVTGQALVPETLLRGYVYTDLNGKVVPDPAASGIDRESLRLSPNEELVAYVKANRVHSDAATEADCGYDDLLVDHLGVYFKQDSLVFTLKGLPHVIFACTEDLLEVPLKDSRPLLTQAGSRYFAALD